MFYVGVDLGGTNIKAGVVDENCGLLCSGDRPTALPRSAQEACEDIVAQILAVVEQAGLSPAEIARIGIGCPGTVNNVTGIVEYSNNLQWRNFPLTQYIQSRLNGIPVSIGNDANVAALGEFYAGSAKGADSAVVITLGTGVGSGAILDSKIITGHNCAATEFGHMVIQYGGRLCTCGRKGCLEAYASASALIAMTKEEMDRNPDSLMWKISEREGKISGKTAFSAMKQGDASGKAVTGLYIGYLACGLANIINILQPEMICLGGGVSKEGDALLLPLREKVYAQLFGGKGETCTEIRLCSLGNDAGIIGAAMLGAG